MQAVHGTLYKLPHTFLHLWPGMHRTSVLCRDEAQKLWTERAQLEAAGLKVVCVVHEWIDREVSCSTNPVRVSCCGAYAALQLQAIVAFCVLRCDAIPDCACGVWWRV